MPNNKRTPLSQRNKPPARQRRRPPAPSDDTETTFSNGMDAIMARLANQERNFMHEMIFDPYLALGKKFEQLNRMGVYQDHTGRFAFPEWATTDAMRAQLYVNVELRGTDAEKAKLKQECDDAAAAE